MTIGERLNQLRIRRGLSYAALAEEIAVPVRLVVRWELDITVPDDEDLEVISDYFEVSVTDLAGDEPDEPEDPEVQESNRVKYYKWYILAALLGVIMIIIVGSLLNIIGTLALILMLLATLNVVFLVIQLIRNQ